MVVRTTVTIARRMGSGGAYVGRVIAERLGLRYVDREVLHRAAETLGVEASALEQSRERVSTFWERFFGSLSFGPPEGPYAPPPLRNFSDRAVFECQTGILREIAAREDCVIVGHGGAFVLPRHRRTVNLYFHAPLKFRVRRLMEVYNLAEPQEAGRMIKESDEMRRRYFARMTDVDWTCADNYHLCIDTSIYPLPELAERLIRFVERKLGIADGTSPQP